MAQSILLRGAKQVLTLRGPKGARRGTALDDLGVIPDGSVLIQDGIIAAVGTTRRIENLKEARTALEIPVNGRVIMPGFVDASLGLSMDSAKNKRMSDFYDDSLALMRACLQHGTLSADVKANAELGSTVTDISVLRKLAHIGSNPVRMVRTWRMNSSADCTEPQGQNPRDTLDVLIRRKLIQSVEVSSQTEKLLDDGMLSAAHQANIGVKLHWMGGTESQLISSLERLRPQTICGIPHITANQAGILAQAGIAVFSAGRDVFEGPIESSARSIVNQGGVIALSSGYDSASAATFSMQMSLALAVVRMGLTIEQAFSAATINAAYAAGCAEITGSLEYGKQADILILNIPDYHELPKQFGINHVDMAFREGNAVLNRTKWKAAATEHHTASRVRSQFL